MASVYDWLLVIGLMMLLSVPVVALLDDAIQPGNNLYRLGLAVVATVFFSCFWTYGGQTLGMKAWRLRLITTDGSPVSLRQALVRFFGACVSALPAGLGFWWLLWDPQQLSWHDRWSGTTIAVLPKDVKPDKLSAAARD
jgi:uncharacterized RDD family membrane protein YckC